MDKSENTGEDLARLKARLNHLERENQWYFSALELAASLGDLHRSRKQQEEPVGLFREVRSLVCRVVPLDTLALYLVEPADAGFSLRWCAPEENAPQIVTRVVGWIDDGSFAWALKQTRPVQLEDDDSRTRWFLHALATRTRILGMVVGRLPDNGPPLRPEKCKVLSIIMQNLAQAMENARLYQTTQTQNQTLEHLVQKRTRDLEAQTGELHRRVQEVQEFAYMASHDLREPIRKMMVFGDRLKNRVFHQLDERAQEYLQAMERASFRMNVLLEGLLDLSRVTTQGRPMQDANLGAILQDTLQGLGPEIEKRGAHIERDQLPTLPIDPLQVHLVFTHLIGNALKFQPQGQRPRITITARHLPEDGWEIGIRDNGIGIPQAQQEKIFKPFERLHRQEDYPGAGLGLAICKKIMERHRGSIRVESLTDQGADFILVFPQA